MTVANLITLLRVVLVPIIVWSMLSGQMMMAFLLFLLAGISDAVDGAVARYFNQQSEFGTVLDPVADKTLLVSVFIVLSYLGYVPLWLVILIVSRDLLIVVGVMLVFVLGKTVTIRPLWVSKANTVAQILLAAWMLAWLAFELNIPLVQLMLEWSTVILTGLSALAYMWEGLKLFAAEEGVAAHKKGDI